MNIFTRFFKKMCKVMQMPYNYTREMNPSKISSKRYGSSKVRIGKPLKYDAMTISFTKSVSKAIAHKRNNNLPVAKYDEKLDLAYLEYPDGHKEYIEET